MIKNTFFEVTCTEVNFIDALHQECVPLSLTGEEALNYSTVVCAEDPMAWTEEEKFPF
jgi:hypothetical protein